jgi:hypothetical protein
MVLGGPEAELAVVGSGFTEASVIVFNGGDERTTFVDPTRVTTIIKPELVGQPITVPVHVRNHMRVSNIVDFTFTEE